MLENLKLRTLQKLLTWEVSHRLPDILTQRPAKIFNKKFYVIWEDGRLKKASMIWLFANVALRVALRVVLRNVFRKNQYANNRSRKDSFANVCKLSFETLLRNLCTSSNACFSINSRADYSHNCIEPLNWVHRRCIIISLDLECGSHWNFSNSVWRGFPLWKTFEERTLFVSESRSKLKSPFEPSYRVELEIVCRLCLLASFRCGNAVECTKFHLWKHFIRGSHPCVFDIQ